MQVPDTPHTRAIFAVAREVGAEPAIRPFRAGAAITIGRITFTTTAAGRVHEIAAPGVRQGAPPKNREMVEWMAAIIMGTTVAYEHTRPREQRAAARIRATEIANAVGMRNAT